MPVRRLPSNPNLEHLKYQAKDLLKAHATRDPAAAQRLREFHPRFKRTTDAAIFAAPLRLADAQLAIARESGFPSWTRLKKHIEKPALSNHLDLPHHERIEDPTFRHAIDLLDAGDAVGLQAYLQQHPNLSRQHVVFEGGNYFRNPTLLEFTAENPIRHGRLPANIVEVTRVILDAGFEPSALNDTLALVATGSVPHQCGVNLPLIDLLCDYGADCEGAKHGVALHGYGESLQALIRRGARIDLPVAASLGQTEDARRLLPSASPEDRHLALTLAADHGHLEVVRLLLDAGEDPNRYNPPGGHSHTTPLHQAALGGYEEVVRLLVERGARLNMKDILFHGTPADWARHAGRTPIEDYLRARAEAEKQ
ncbi:MAG TPA: ankyrin repeat domain-containing protein [Candidatus Angelobacter sp.]|nr:ankyrin repeat domain-containing protein [Candidatus Angelobacter sp.]